MNNDKFQRFCEFRIKNILLSHTFLGTNKISCTIVILTVQQILLKRPISSQERSQPNFFGGWRGTRANYGWVKLFCLLWWEWRNKMFVPVIYLYT